MKNLPVALVCSFKRPITLSKLIEKYKPEHEIILLWELLKLKKDFDTHSTEQCFWPLIDSLSRLLSAKIEFSLNELRHSLSKDRKISGDEFSFAISAILNLITFAKEVLGKFSYTIDFEAHKLEILELKSLFKNPLHKNEARVFFTELSINENPNGYNDLFKRAYRIKNFPLDVNPGKDEINITPLPELAEDDYTGQQPKAMGCIAVCPIGTILIGDKRFTLIETEEDFLGIPVRELLSRIGGCPYGYRFDSTRGYSLYNYGFDFETGRCSCSLLDCPGNSGLVIAGKLEVLVSKVSQIMENSNAFESLGFEKRRTEE